MLTLGIDEVPWDDPDAVRLRADQRTELDARYGTGDHEPGDAPTADTITIFLIARDAAGHPLGCGGLRTLDPGSVEVKRMYVTPEARGTGVATAILRALEAKAAERGAVRLFVETGTRQPDAIRFYRREGYTPIAQFGPYVGDPRSLCFARTL